MLSNLIKPKQGSLQVNVFGGGVGESIVIHLPEGKYIVVDSFTNFDTKRSVILDFLEFVGASLETDVLQIVVSHWHDDHISGIAKVIETCPNAKVICAAALMQKDFMKLVLAQRKHKPVLNNTPTGVDEFFSISKILGQRKQATNVNGYTWAIPDRVLFKDNSNNIEIVCLSPSDQEFSQAVEKFASIVGAISVGQPKQAVCSDDDPNDTAIALVINYKDTAIVLGSDLEQTGNDKTGWTAALNSQCFPKTKVKILKVPHHGSKNAFNQQFWDNHLEKNGIVALTPYNRSHLPREIDKDRILSYSTNSFIGADKPKSKPKKRDLTIDKIVNESLKSRKIHDTKIGCIQIDVPSDGSNSIVNLAGAAMKMQTFEPVK